MADSPVQLYTGGEMTLARDIGSALKEAEDAAAALKGQVFKRLPPPTVNGKQYPTNEHWQTVASFYGVFPRAVGTHYVEYGEAIGFEATYEAVHSASGQVVSRAEAACLTDEPRWKDRPLHQLKAMAQTRASSRCLKNVFSRIMVLAGCEATPAEDMDDEHGERRQAVPTGINEKQWKRLWAVAFGKKMQAPEINQWLTDNGADPKAKGKDITPDRYEAMVKALEAMV